MKLIIIDVNQPEALIRNNELSLHKLKFPFFHESETKPLYFKGNYIISNNSIFLNKMESISTDAYFNRFPIDIFRDNTVIESVSIDIFLEGKFRITLWNKNAYDTILLNSVNLETSKLEKHRFIDHLLLSDLSGYLFISIDSLSENCKIVDIDYISEMYNFQMKTKLTVIICTYKRESYVLNNLNLLNIFFKKNQNRMIDIIVVDNGHTLSRNLNSRNIKIIQNPNEGGTGGFTRGLIECLNMQNDNNDHYCLFMDDDIKFDPLQLSEMHTLINIREKEIIIGSPMIRLEFPFRFIQEKGAYLKNGFLPDFIQVKPERDASNEINLFRTEDNISYTSWWWFAFPIRIISNAGLPFPFFIKFDDIEYSRRLLENGIDDIVIPDNYAVWHEPFHNKMNSAMDYYQWKNYWIYRALYNESIPFLSYLYGYLRESLLFISAYKYQHFQLFNKAVKDFLTPDIKKFKDQGSRINYLTKIIFNELYRSDLGDIEKDDILERENWLLRFIRIISLNGLLLPSFGTIKINDFSITKYRKTFMKKKVFYYSPYIKKGYWTCRRNICALKCAFSIFCTIIRIITKYTTATWRYSIIQKDLISKDFWDDILRID